MIHCGSSPAAPTTSAMSVALNPASIVAGSNGQGTVSITSTAPTGGASVALSSSNTAVATVQTPVTIQAGSSSATFVITAVGAGTATITASTDGKNSQSPTLTVTNGPGGLASISLSAASVVGGNAVTGTATLSAPAPGGGAVVSLSGSDPVTVPASVTVSGGTMSATFPVTTRAVGGTIASTINGSYGGGTASAALSVTQPTIATASFGIQGPTESDTCTMANGGQTLNCTFNGTTSTAPGTITAYDWSYGVAKMFTQTTSGAVLTTPTVDCSLLPAPPLPAGSGWLTIVVSLRVHDSLGNVSAVFTDGGARLLPQGVCGY